MRYYAYFLSTTDATVSAPPRATNVMVKRGLINVEFIKKIPLSNVQSTAVEHTASDKAFSVGKAGAGLLIAGPVGLVGGALGGKKVTSILTITYLNDDGQAVDIKLEGKAVITIRNKIEVEKHRQKQEPRKSKPRKSILRTIFWSWILAAKLMKRLMNR